MQKWELKKQPGGSLSFVDSQFVGKCGAYVENLNGRMVTQFFSEAKLSLVNTFWDAGSTYWGPNGDSRPDYIFTTAACLQNVEKCKVLNDAGTKMQLIKSAKPADHFPLLTRFFVDAPHSPPNSTASTSSVVHPPR